MAGLEGMSRDDFDGAPENYRTSTNFDRAVNSTGGHSVDEDDPYWMQQSSQETGISDPPVRRVWTQDLDCNGVADRISDYGSYYTVEFASINSYQSKIEYSYTDPEEVGDYQTVTEVTYGAPQTFTQLPSCR